MSQERIEAAAKAFVTLTQRMNEQNFAVVPDAEDIEEQVPFIAAALAAADAVMFSDEAIERAARAMLDAMYDDKTLKVDDGDRAIVRVVVAALKGDA